ncbi:response regulator [Burkholderia sp. M6-3]
MSISNPLKIFLIEDSIPVRGQLAALIGNIDGVEAVGEAETADAATSAIGVCGPDVAVVDFHLAQDTAMDVLANLAGSNRHVITIVLTNHATATVREACRRAGADYFSTRPANSVWHSTPSG